MQGIGRGVAGLTARAQTFPIALRDFRVTTARWRTYGAAVLLRAGHPIRKAIIGCDVINLRGRLVVPGTPRLGGIDADYGSLIALEYHALWIVGIDPKLMKVIAGRIALDRFPSLARISLALDGRVHYVNLVGVLPISGDFRKVPAASPQAFIARKPSPRRAGIVRAKDATRLFRLGWIFRMIFVVDERINNGVDTIVIGWRD